jgi:thymidylate synthase (FAD)
MTAVALAHTSSIDDILGQEFKVLDHGFIRVVDYMGSDEAVVQAARTSYGKGTKQRSEDRGLIRYLMRHRHSTPFEMCEIKLHVKLPIFVARQWVRHRTANINEYSARYSILDKEFYVPDVDVMGAQSKANKQGRDGSASTPETVDHLRAIMEISTQAYETYERLLNGDADGEKLDPDREGLARELARIVLPTNFYTQWYWKIDLHNLLHFLALRMDAHAQHEIQEYARVIAAIVEKWVPLTWEAFVDYRQTSLTFSGPEVGVLKRLLRGEVCDQVNSELSPREWREFCAKLDIAPR